MRFTSAAAAAALLFATPAFASLDHYTFDKDHTNIVFHINHLGFSEMVGLMTSYDGNLLFDPHHPQATAIRFWLAANP